MTSSIIPYLVILYRHMGPPTTPGPQAPHHLNPALMKCVISKVSLMKPRRSLRMNKGTKMNAPITDAFICHFSLTNVHFKNQPSENQPQLKSLCFLQAFKESTDWVLLSSFCDDSNLTISLCK